MTTELRPYSLGEILDHTAQLYRKNFLLFTGIAALPALATFAFNMLISFITPTVQAVPVAAPVAVAANPALAMFDSPGKIVSVLLGYIVLVVLSILGQAAITVAITRTYLSEQATIRGAFAYVLPRFWSLIWLTFLESLAIGWPILLASILVGVASAGLSGSIGPILTGTLIFFFVIAVIVYLIWMVIRYSFAVAAFVVEDLRGFKAMRRSVHLTKGTRGRIFVLFLLYVVLALMFGSISGIAAFIAAKNHLNILHPHIVAGFTSIYSAFTSTLLAPILSAALILFYYDQRVRKEGFDIEWLMGNAGLVVPVAPPMLETAPAATTLEEATPGFEYAEPALSPSPYPSEPIHEPVQDATPEPIQDPTPEPAQDPMQHPPREAE